MIPFLEQCLNGVQFGMLLFLLAAGLTLVFGIMDLVNLAHGSLYMMGAYFAATFVRRLDSVYLGLVAALVAALLLGIAIEVLVMRRLYRRDHLDHVLATFGLILFFNEAVRLVWGPAGLTVPLPEALRRSVEVLPGVPYSAYRLAIIGVGLAVAAFLYLLVQRTRVGMLIRAGASNREMVQSLGLDIQLVYRLVFALGVALAAFAGMIAAPVSSVYPGMGTQVLIICFVVVVTGGIGSVRGALLAALLIGVVDTFGRVLVPEAAGITVYLLMAAILVWRPEGLFGRA